MTWTLQPIVAGPATRSKTARRQNARDARSYLSTYVYAVTDAPDERQVYRLVSAHDHIIDALRLEGFELRQED